MEKEKVICDAAGLFGDICTAAAAFCGEECICENKTFTELSGTVPSEKLYAAAYAAVSSSGGIFRSVCGGFLITSFVLRRRDEVCVAGIKLEAADSGGLPALGIEDNRAVYENEEFRRGMFSDIKESLTALALKAAYSDVRTCAGICGGMLCRAFAEVKGDDSTALVVFRAGNIFSELPREIRDNIIGITSRVRSGSQIIGACSDQIYELGRLSSCASEITDNLNNIDRSLLMIRSEFLVFEELMRYVGEEPPGEPVSLEQFAEDYCSELILVTDENADETDGKKHRKKLRVKYSCENGLVAYFRQETLKMILTELVVKAMERYSGCKYFMLDISGVKKDGADMIRINAIVSERGFSAPAEKSAEQPYDRIDYLEDFSPADFYEALTAAFCTAFSCRRIRMEQAQPGIIMPGALGLLLPVYRDERSVVSLNKGYIRKSMKTDWLYSSSRAELAANVFRKKYK